MKSIKVLILFSLIMILTPPAAYSEGGAPDGMAPEGTAQAGDLPGGGELLQKVQERYRGITDITATFDQVAYSGTLKDTIVSKGTLYLKRGGKIYWDYLGEHDGDIISNGTTIWLYQEDLGQVVKRSAAGRNAPNLLLNPLEGIGTIEDDFNVTRSGGDEETFTLKLTFSKAAESPITGIYLKVGREDHIIVETAIEDRGGSRTAATFSKIMVNTGLKDERFEFKVPKGVKVIKQ